MKDFKFGELKEKLMQIHLPAKIYLALVIIAILMNFMYMSWHHLLFTVIFVIVWTYIIEYVCKKGFKNSVWILVVLPFAIMFFAKSIAMNQMLAKIASSMTSKAPAESHTNTSA